MRRFNVAAVLTAAALVLTACGSSGSGSSGSGTPTSTPAPPASSPGAASPASSPAGTEPAGTSPAGSSVPASPTGPLTDFKIAYGATAATNIPLYIGIDDGIFAKYGLNVSMVLLAGTATPPALASNSVQLAQSGVSDMAGAIVGGANLSIVAVGYPWMFFRVYGKKGMTSLADLKGKTIAASTAGSASDTAINIAMKSTGLVRGKDYQVTYIGDNPARIAALANGSVDAILVSPPSAQLAEAQGFPDIGDMISEKIPYGYGSFGVNKEWAASHKDLLIAFFKAYHESVLYARNNKDAAFAVMKKDMNLTNDSILQSVYDVSVAIMPEWPIPTADPIKATTIYSSNPKVVAVDPNTLFDDSYVKAAQAASG